MIHFHHWGPWQDATVEMSAGPLGRKLGLPNAWEEPVQVRTCSKCGKRKLRRLT